MKLIKPTNSNINLLFPNHICYIYTLSLSHISHALSWILLHAITLCFRKHYCGYIMVRSQILEKFGTIPQIPRNDKKKVLLYYIDVLEGIRLTIYAFFSRYCKLRTYLDVMKFLIGRFFRVWLTILRIWEKVAIFLRFSEIGCCCTV
jgi:hypothetical protein